MSSMGTMRDARRRCAYRALAATSAVAMCGLLLAACGIPTQPSASAIPASQLHARRPVTPPTESPCAKGCTSINVYFVSSKGRLVPVGRIAPPHDKVGAVVGAMLAGPTPAERATGFSTALPTDIRLLSTTETLKRRTITLNFSVDFATLSGPQEVLGVAQVVYTVSSITPGVGVIFEIASVPVQVPLETGRLVNGAVHVPQYESLLTTTVPTTTTP